VFKLLVETFLLLCSSSRTHQCLADHKTMRYEQCVWQVQNAVHDHSPVCRCAIQSLQDQQLSGPSKPVDSVLGALDVPKPDRGPSCKAMIGYCQALTVWMAASVTILQRLADLNKQASAARIPEQQLSVEASSTDLLRSLASCTSRPIVGDSSGRYWQMGGVHGARP